MSNLYHNFKRGSITDNPLGAGTLNINSAEFATLPEINAPDILAITLDPDGIGGTPEICYITSHTPASSTTVTVTRGMEQSLGGSAGRPHNLNTQWRHPVTAQNLVDFVAGDLLPFAHCAVYDVSQTITDNSTTVINPWGTVISDPLGWSIGSGQIRPTIEGVYEMHAGARIVTATTNVQRVVGIPRKNGANELPYIFNFPIPTGVSSDSGGSGVSKAIAMNGTTDYFEFGVGQDDISSISRAMESFMTVKLLWPT